MKSILLCVAIGLAIFTAQVAYAQDTTYHPSPDSLHSDTATSASLTKDQLRQDSMLRAHTADSIQIARKLSESKDSTLASVASSAAATDRKDTTASTPHQQQLRGQDSTVNKKQEPDSSKIVDIFEEMAAARDQQEQNIKKEAALEQAEKKAAQQATQKAISQKATAEGQINAQIAQAKQQIQDTTDNERDIAVDTSHPNNTPRAAQPANKDSLEASKASAISVQPAVKHPLNRPLNQSLNQPGEQNADQPADVRHTDSATLDAPVNAVKRDTIQSIFTLQDTSPAAESAENKDTAGVEHQTAPHPLDSALSKVAPTAAATAQDKKVKDSLNQLFAATAEAATTDSSGQITLTEDSSQSPEAGTAINNASAAGLKGTKAAEDQKEAKAQSLAPDTSNRPVNKPGQNNLPDTILARHPRGSSQIVVSADSLAPQNTPFTALFQPYRIFNKETNISSTTSLTILQQNVDYKTSADFTTQYQRTGEREGNFLFDVSVVKLNTEVETMGVQLKYDSNKKSDSTSTFAKPLFDIVGKRTFIQVDSTGKITAIDHSALGRQVNTVLSGLSLSGGDFEVGSNFGLLVSKPGIAGVGQQWTDSVSHGGNKRVTTYKVQSVLDGDLLVTISGTVSQTGDITSDGAVFKTHFTGTQTGKMYVEQQTLLVKSRDITLNMKGTVDYNGQPLPASGVSRIKEKVTPD